MLTVSIPVWRTPVALLERAVESVLSNEAVTRVVVTGDGEPVDWWSDDPRVLVWCTEHNRGRYFIDDVVSRACTTPYFTTHDADDYSDAGRLDALIGAGVDVAYTNRTTDAGGARKPRPVRRRPRVPVDVLWGVMAVYRASVVQGLFHPGYRVSWDAVLDNIGYRFLNHRLVPGYAYHIVKRPESLTMASSTGIGSEYRQAVTGPQRRLWSVLEGAAGLHEVKRVIEDTVHPRMVLVRDAEVERLKGRL